MIKNFFVLNRLINELNGFAAGSVLYSAYSQEKEKLILECRKGINTFFLEISVNPQFQYFIHKEKFFRAKKNVVDFFKDILPFQNINISIAHLDRVIKVGSDKGELFFFIKGNNTNVIAHKPGLVESFKKTNSDKLNILLQDLGSLQYENAFINFVPPEGQEDYNRKYPFLGKDLIIEAKLRDEDNLQQSIVSVIKDIKEDTPAVFHNNTDIKLAFDNFRSFIGWEKETFNTVSDAINHYVIKKHSAGYFLDRKKVLINSITRELEKISARLNNLKDRIEKGSKEEEYNKIANLLLINLHKFDRGSDVITLDDIYSSGEQLKIKIDPSLSPQKNADKYFEKSRNEKIGYIKSKELFNSSLEKYKQLQEKYSNLIKAGSSEELKLMEKNKVFPVKKDTDDIQSKFRQYLIDGKYKLYVGRDSEKNDLLTTRFAKQNDYWFHARSVSGSHVVLRVESSKEPIPKSVLKKAASIAAFHSKAKTSSLTPVSYTLKKYVTKRKGMEKGKVSLLKEDVLLVKPEIPAGCEYLTND